MDFTLVHGPLSTLAGALNRRETSLPYAAGRMYNDGNQKNEEDGTGRCRSVLYGISVDSLKPYGAAEQHEL